MGYYIRAFCTHASPPDLGDVQRWLASRASAVVFADISPSAAMWTTASLEYKSGKRPILLECNRAEGADGMFRGELEEFLEFVSEGRPARSRKVVAAHLAASTFVVACQLPTSDIDDDGYAASGAFLTYFVEHCGGLIQADGEGFYRGNKLLLEVD